MLFIIPVALISCFHPRLYFLDTHNPPITKNTKPDSAAVVFLAPWHDSIFKSMDRVIGFADTAFIPNAPSGNLNNLAADLVYLSADSGFFSQNGFHLDACILNRGGLRATIPRDSIHLSTIYEVMPFENEVVILHISGAAMDSMLNHIAKLKGAAVAGMKLEIGPTGYQNAVINSRRFDSRREYWIATNDFMAQGGDGFVMLAYPLSAIYTKTKVRDAMISGIQDECNTHGRLLPRPENRIIRIQN